MTILLPFWLSKYIINCFVGTSVVINVPFVYCTPFLCILFVCYVDECKIFVLEQVLKAKKMLSL